MRLKPVAVLGLWLAAGPAAAAPPAKFDLVCRDTARSSGVTRLSVDLKAMRWCRTGYCKPYRRWKIKRISGRQVMLREEGGTRIVYDRRSGDYFHWSNGGKRTERRWACKEAPFTPF
ncbi:MAG TPA: hypothetical protein VEA44_04545 [Caulobacter sp.]|nr:hypothetical protein [Caulobacter sp.]